MREYLAIFLIVAYLAGGIGIILFFGGELHRYKTAFRRVAAQLFTVTAERNAAEIKLAGCKRELTKALARICELEEQYESKPVSVDMSKFQIGIESSELGISVEPFDLSGDE